MPPSGANTSSFCAIALARTVGNAWPAVNRQRKHVSCRYFRQGAVAQFEQQPARLIETYKAALRFCAVIPYRYLFAHAVRAVKPIGKDGRKAMAAVPLREAAAHGGRQTPKQLRRRYRCTVRLQVCGRE